MADFKDDLFSVTFISLSRLYLCMYNIFFLTNEWISLKLGGDFLPTLMSLRHNAMVRADTILVTVTFYKVAGALRLLNFN